MMKKAMLAAMCAATLLGMVTTAQADWGRGEYGYGENRSNDYGRGEYGEWRGGIRTRIREADARIDRGIERGSLTPREADRLRMELNGILGRIDRMRDDGHLDHREREIINRDLDRLDQDITREKHDGQYRDRGYQENHEYRERVYIYR